MRGVAGSSSSRLDAFRSLARDAAILGIVGSDSNNGYAVLNAALTVENVDSSIPPGQVTMAVRLAGTEPDEDPSAPCLVGRPSRTIDGLCHRNQRELITASVVIAERGLEEAEAVIPTLAGNSAAPQGSRAIDLHAGGVWAPTSGGLRGGD